MKLALATSLLVLLATSSGVHSKGRHFLFNFQLFLNQFLI